MGGMIRAFISDDRAAATTEFVLWVPIFVLGLVATTDATVLYLHHTEMWNVSRDIARRVAVGIMTEADAVAAVQNEMFLYSRAYNVATSDPAELDVWIKIETKVADASVFGFFEPVLDRYLSASVTMRREPF